MNSAAALALTALVPLIAGTSPHEARADAITVALCNGGEITLDLGREDPAQERDCDQKGCHAGTCREKDKVKPGAKREPAI
ncbi:MAG: hypothetical protein AAF559_08385 [Pseudomonadota bacterium]